MTDSESQNQNPPPLEPDEEISFEEGFRRTVEKLRPYVRALWAAKKKFIYFNGAVLVVVLAILIFLVKPYYVSTVTILPDYGSKETSLSQLSGLASLAGVSVGGGTPTDVYQNLLTSQVVLYPVIYAKYKTHQYPDSVNLIQYFGIKPKESLPASEQRRYLFLTEFEKLLKKGISTNLNRTTKILDVSVTMPEPELSAEVVNRAVESLDNYIRTKRKSYATDQLSYIEKRMGQVKDSLRVAEDILRDFREQNRLVAQSPELMLQQSRLTRNVEILGSVYLELSKQYELAKIDVIKDTPIVNVEEYAGNPVIKAGPNKFVILIFVMVLSALFSALYLGFKENIRKYIGYIKGK